MGAQSCSLNSTSEIIDNAKLRLRCMEVLCMTSYVYTQKAVLVAKFNNYIELYVWENYVVWKIVNDNSEFNRK